MVRLEAHHPHTGFLAEHLFNRGLTTADKDVLVFTARRGAC